MLSSSSSTSVQLRVSIDGLGYVGLVEVSLTASLAAVRASLALTFDADTLPRYYTFLGAHGASLGTRHELTVIAASLPSLTLLPTTECPVAGESFAALLQSVRHHSLHFSLPTTTTTTSSTIPL